MAKIVVCGSRSITDYDLLKNTLDRLIDKTSDAIISGGAKGVDQLAEKYAKENNISFEVIKADWENLGKSAGMKRNIVMINKADKVIALWNGMSPGTNFSIDYAKKHNKLMEIIYV